MPNKTKKTRLNKWHRENGANMVTFGSYEMPVWYTAGAKLEHLAVLTAAGIFDTSHMTVLTVSGPDAFTLLQTCFTRDLTCCIGKNKGPIKPGKSVYGAFLNEKGEVMDDAILYNTGKNSHMVVVNSGMGNKISVHLEKYSKGLDVKVADHSDNVGKIDIQGPESGKILLKVLKDPKDVLENMGWFTFKGHFDQSSPASKQVLLKDNTSVLVSRTGYTGEFGFEIFTTPDDLIKVWEVLLVEGKDFGLIPCGLAARDSLRTGAMLPLSHQDIGTFAFADNPWTFILPDKKKDKGFTKKFVGHEALVNIKNIEYTYAFIGNDLRKVSVCDPAVVTDSKGNKIGVVTTCVSDMAMGRHNGRVLSVSSPDKPEGFKPKGLSCGFVRVKSQLAMGQEIELRDNRRKLKAVIVDDIRPHRTVRNPIKEMLN
jgi:aminomethyltransferase